MGRTRFGFTMVGVVARTSPAPGSAVCGDPAPSLPARDGGDEIAFTATRGDVARVAATSLPPRPCGEAAPHASCASRPDGAD